MYSPVTARKQFSEALCRWLTDRPDVVFSVFFARGFLERGDANSDVADFLPLAAPRSSGAWSRLYQPKHTSGRVRQWIRMRQIELSGMHPPRGGKNERTSAVV